MIFYAKSDLGRKRKNNEDAFFAKSYNDDIGLFIVADGLGGYESGEVASNLLVKVVSDYFETYKDSLKRSSTLAVKNIIKKAIEIANEKIYTLEKTDEKYKGMGTTVTLFLKFYDKLYYLNVGDSRIYYLDKNKNNIIQITEDDTYVNKLLKENIICEKEAKNHPQKHVLTKAIGILENIDFEVKELNENFGYIFMCTDGVTNMLNDNDVLKIVKQNDDKYIVDEIVKTANLNGGVDNITAVLIKL